MYYKILLEMAERLQLKLFFCKTALGDDRFSVYPRLRKGSDFCSTKKH